MPLLAPQPEKKSDSSHPLGQYARPWLEKPSTRETLSEGAVGVVTFGREGARPFGAEEVQALAEVCTLAAVTLAQLQVT